MRTPKEYTENLKKGIVTLAMLDDVLFSYNKRAKNYRDKAQEYREKRRWNRYWYDKYDNEGKCEEKKQMLYDRKSDILSCCPKSLKAVHKLTKQVKIRIEDNEPEYCEYEKDIARYLSGSPSKVIYMNSYYDREIEEVVNFINVYVDRNEYYLYYEFPNHSFHHPITEADLAKYKDLQVISLDSLATYGEDIIELLPLPFCDKVWAFVKTSNIGSLGN